MKKGFMSLSEAVGYTRRAVFVTLFLVGVFLGVLYPFYTNTYMFVGRFEFLNEVFSKCINWIQWGLPRMTSSALRGARWALRELLRFYP